MYDTVCQMYVKHSLKKNNKLKEGKYDNLKYDNFFKTKQKLNYRRSFIYKSKNFNTNIYT